MPIGYKVAHDGKLVVEVWTGRIAAEEMYAHQETTLGDPRVQAGRSEFIDITRATNPHVGDEELQRFVDAYRTKPEKAVNTSIAVVATGETFEQARLFERLTIPHMITVVVFNDTATACTWLGVDESEIRGHVRDVLRDMSAS